MPTKEEIQAENKKIRYLRLMVDLTFNLICTSDMTREDAARHVAGIRGFASKLFPGKDHVFDLVYAPRFTRLLTSKYRLS
ncbi:MAG: hypothetical protein ACE5EB_01640 [Thermodesulfobacteriota bacterium]